MLIACPGLPGLPPYIHCTEELRTGVGLSNVGFHVPGLHLSGCSLSFGLFPFSPSLSSFLPSSLLSSLPYHFPPSRRGLFIPEPLAFPAGRGWKILALSQQDPNLPSPLPQIEFMSKPLLAAPSCILGRHPVREACRDPRMGWGLVSRRLTHIRLHLPISRGGASSDPAAAA